MVPSCTETYKAGGKKLYAYAMAIINILVTNMHIVSCFLVILYILGILRQISMTGYYAVAYIALTLWHQLYQLRTHTGERFVYWMWGYCTYATLGKRHTSLHTGHWVAGYMPFVCMKCDFITSIRPVPMVRNKVAVPHITFWTSWDYSLSSINLHNAGKKY